MEYESGDRFPFNLKRNEIYFLMYLTLMNFDLISVCFRNLFNKSIFEYISIFLPRVGYFPEKSPGNDKKNKFYCIPDAVFLQMPQLCGETQVARTTDVIFLDLNLLFAQILRIKNLIFFILKIIFQGMNPYPHHSWKTGKDQLAVKNTYSYIYVKIFSSKK